MADAFKITATPSLYPAGEYEGKLKSVTFTAVSENDTRQWFAKNCGHFETAFSKIMPASLAKVMVAALTHGDDIEFPGAYPEYQFARGFLFEWSPLYLVLPPIFFARPEPA
jgi:hypothetical protein